MAQLVLKNILAGSGNVLAGGDNSGNVTKVTIGTNLTLTGGVLSATGGGSGSVTSVAMTVPTGLTITGSPITTTGTLDLTYSAGYSIPTTIKQSNWDDAYTWVSGFPTQTGNAGKYLTTDGSVLSWATLPSSISGSGTTNTLPKFTAASTIGNSNITDTGSLITLNSNTNINASLGIGTTSITNYNIRNSKNLTGSTVAYGISIDGTIQSGVTSTARFYHSAPTTVASAFTLSSLQHYVVGTTTIGSGSSITNQFGFLVLSTAIGATNNYAFSGQLAAASNTWNLYNSGTANNYMAGSLGIGTTSLTGLSLVVSKNITGAITSYGIYSNGQIQSDVTTTAYMYRSFASTAAATFTLADLIHYNAGQGTFGASSTVTTQYGFNVSSSLVGATTNYGFFGNIPSGTGRWNLYMNGTASNYLSGTVLIGTTTDAGYKLYISGSVGATGGYFEASDKRLKKELADNPIIENIAKIKPKKYLKEGKEELGYYAQDLQDVLPIAVSEGKDGFLALSYTQVHTAKIAQLENKIEQLEKLIYELGRNSK